MHIYSSPKNSKNPTKVGVIPEMPAIQGADEVLNVAIVGARGYSGLELCRGLLVHPAVASITLGLNESQFEIEQLLPEKITKIVQKKSVQQLIEDASKYDLIFLATPAEVSMELTTQLLKSKTRVIDLSGAFRLDANVAYQKWYNFEHQAVELLSQAQYGLSPFNVSLNKETSPLVANPGCYATSILMALVPLLRAEVIDPDFIVIDAKSGTTGAGRKAAENLLFSEVDGECLPYRIAKHQHFPEICQHTLKLTGKKIDPMFSTSLIPVRRGIIAGIYTRLNPGQTQQDVETAYRNAFENYPLVKVAQADRAPDLLSLKRVVGSARTHLAYVADQSSTADKSKLYIYSSIDNLMKGAASQAIENMNHLWGWPVETGLLSREGVL
jgi:N-acetyl-gamma-glutamyl-phosphate reductase